MNLGSHHRIFVICTGVVFGLTMLCRAVLAQNVSFKVEGTYAVYSTIGPHVGSGIGILHVDSTGVVTGYALLNIPATATTRTTLRVPVNSTLTMNADGTGRMSSPAVTLPDGTKLPPVDDDFVITKAARQGNAWVATEMFDQREQPSGVLGAGYEVTITWKRLPDQAGREQ